MAHRDQKPIGPEEYKKYLFKKWGSNNYQRVRELEWEELFALTNSSSLESNKLKRALKALWENPRLLSELDTAQQRIHRLHKERKVWDDVMIDYIHNSLKNEESSKKLVQRILALNHPWAEKQDNIHRGQRRNLNQKYWITPRILLKVHRVSKFIPNKTDVIRNGYGKTKYTFFMSFEDMGGTIYEEIISRKQFENWN
ncbi:hypothetical protein GF420_15635 [candidate division GN15 bacterium]|nr:hypothetical protein [candidate division GN15 bacterium]